MNKKYFFLLATLFCIMGGVNATSINTNSGIVAKQLYQIRAYDDGSNSNFNRGALYAGNSDNNGAHPNGHLSACGSTLGGSGYGDFSSITISTSDVYQQFAFIQVGSNYYLYSVGAKSLCYVSGNYVLFGTTAETVTLKAATATNYTNFALMQFGTSSRYLTFSNNTSGQHAIFAQSSLATSTTDGGNLLQIIAIDGATLSDADLLYAENLIDGRINTAITNAQAALDASTENQVGYPVASERTTLSTAITTFQNLVTANTATDTDLNTLTSAISTYKATASINYPEDGKAYKIVAVHPNGTEQPLYYTGSAVGGFVESEISDIYDAYWVCHKTSETENKYLFVNHNGFYLNWFCDENKGLNMTGVSTTYNADYNVWTVARATTSNATSGSSIDSGTTDVTLFGRFQLNAKGSGSNYYYLITRYNTTTTDGVTSPAAATFHAGAANNKFYMASNNNTFTYKLVEVDYYNKLKFQTPLTADGNDYASIYLPYAATVPTGATAYIGALNSDNSKLTLTEITDGIIPKNTAVVMSAPSESALGTVYVAPATEAGTTETTGNVLKGTVDAGDCSRNLVLYTYVLNGGYGEIGFYKYTASNLPLGRAYFEVSTDAPASGTGAGVQGFLFDFGEEEGETTGINAAALSNGNAAKTYYDLSGRRIANPKNGLYICNGKKVYIK